MTISFESRAAVLIQDKAMSAPGQEQSLNNTGYGHTADMMTEHGREHAGMKLLLLEQPYSTASHDESTARESVVAGLVSGMDYWASLAVGWIEGGLPVDAGLAELLLEIAKCRSMPQRLRHRAVALAKRWQKNMRATDAGMRE